MLITVDEIIKNVIPESNIDHALLKLNVKIAELKYIRKALGATLYNTLLSEYDVQTFTGNNKELLTDYIQPALSYYVVYESLPIIAAEPTSSGFNKNTPVDTLPGTGQDFALLRNQFLSNAEMYIDLMREFACTNSITLAGEGISNKHRPLLYG